MIKKSDPQRPNVKGYSSGIIRKDFGIPLATKKTALFNNTTAKIYTRLQSSQYWHHFSIFNTIFKI
jgi:hypothetical protein